MSQRDGFASGFFFGAIVGSVVGGVLGAVVASRGDSELAAEQEEQISMNPTEAKKIISATTSDEEFRNRQHGDGNSTAIARR